MTDSRDRCPYTDPVVDMLVPDIVLASTLGIFTVSSASGTLVHDYLFIRFDEYTVHDFL